MVRMSGIMTAWSLSGPSSIMCMETRRRKDKRASTVEPICAMRGVTFVMVEDFGFGNCEKSIVFCFFTL